MTACADAIALYKGKLVLVERLKKPKGLALPGGHKERGESLEGCIVREFFEETGLALDITYQLHTYSDPKRDPRGEKIATVFYGEAHGRLRNEPGKTRVVLMNLKDIDANKDRFVFDHYQIIKDWRKKITFF